MPKKYVFIPIFIATFFAAVAAVYVLRDENLDNFSSHEVGAWLWQSPAEFNTDELRTLFASAKDHNIDAIYVDIGDVMGISEIKDKTEQEQKRAEYTRHLEEFIGIATEYGVEVQALAGNPMWSNKSHQYIPQRLLSFVLAYNTSHSDHQKFRGCQFDIEPYSQKNFDKQAERVMTDYLALAHLLTNQVAESDPALKLGFAVPYWYDGSNKRIPLLEWQGASKPVGFHLMDILNKLPGGYIAIMDYRNVTNGKNGSIALAKDEFDYAESNAPRVRIVIGQETSDTKPKSITFYRHTKADVKSAVSELADAFGSSPVLGGFAIHHFESYRDLRD